MNQTSTPPSYKQLPSPKKHWLWKHMKAFAPNSLTFIMGSIHEFGDTFAAEIPTRKFIMMGNAKLIKHVLQTNYHKTRSYDEMKLLLSNSLITSRGDFWCKQRRLAQPAFYKKNLETTLNN